MVQHAADPRFLATIGRIFTVCIQGDDFVYSSYPTYAFAAAGAFHCNAHTEEGGFSVNALRLYILPNTTRSLKEVCGRPLPENCLQLIGGTDIGRRSVDTMVCSRHV